MSVRFSEMSDRLECAKCPCLSRYLAFVAVSGGAISRETPRARLPVGFTLFFPLVCRLLDGALGNDHNICFRNIQASFTRDGLEISHAECKQLVTPLECGKSGGLCSRVDAAGTRMIRHAWLSQDSWPCSLDGILSRRYATENPCGVGWGRLCAQNRTKIASKSHEKSHV